MVLEKIEKKIDSIRLTESVCNICLKKIPAETFEREGRIFIRKQCDEHGEFLAPHFWDDPEIYAELLKIKTFNPISANISVCLTAKCNLNCSVCYAKANEKDSPDFDVNNLDVIENYKGVLLTGGEPTVRKDLPKIIRKIREKGRRVTIFSNGLRMAKRNYLKLLKKSGLSSVIMQFDTLNEKVSALVRKENIIERKKEAIRNLQREEITLYLYSVVLKNSPDEIKKILKFSLHYPVIKMISFNTLGMIGRCDKEDFLCSSQIVRRICKTLRINKKEWIQSSQFLNSMDKFFSTRRKSRRLFSKCSLKCLVIFNEREVVPITKVFNVERINRNAEKMSFIFFVLTFLYREVMLNFFRNSYFRMFLVKIIKNIRYLIVGKKSLFNPFFVIAVTVVPSPENIDYDFLKECNIHAITQTNLDPEPACLCRIRRGQ